LAQRQDRARPPRSTRAAGSVEVLLRRAWHVKLKRKDKREAGGSQAKGIRNNKVCAQHQLRQEKRLPSQEYRANLAGKEKEEINKRKKKLL